VAIAKMVLKSNDLAQSEKRCNQVNLIGRYWFLFQIFTSPLSW
jgi:hypothetical protein